MMLCEERPSNKILDTIRILSSNGFLRASIEFFDFRMYAVQLKGIVRLARGGAVCAVDSSVYKGWKCR